jgi:hypothetical protein
VPESVVVLKGVRRLMLKDVGVRSR